MTIFVVMRSNVIHIDFIARRRVAKPFCERDSFPGHVLHGFPMGLAGAERALEGQIQEMFTQPAPDIASPARDACGFVHVGEAAAKVVAEIMAKT